MTCILLKLARRSLGQEKIREIVKGFIPREIRGSRQTPDTLRLSGRRETVTAVVSGFLGDSWQAG